MTRTHCASEHRPALRSTRRSTSRLTRRLALGLSGRAPVARVLAGTLAVLALAGMPVLAQNSFGSGQAPGNHNNNQQQPPRNPPQQQQPQPMPPQAFPQQQQPQQQGGYGNSGTPGQQGGNAPRMSPEQMSQAERQDMGVRASDKLHTGPMHGPTPNALPGGQLITTPGLVALIQAGMQASMQGGGAQGGMQGGSQGGMQGGMQGGSQGGMQGAAQGGGQPQALVFDVLGGPERLPGAQYAVPAHQAGSFDDAVQRDFGNYLQSVTQGRKDTPLVFYCQSVQCWMSYNAALRATRMGYRNVLWYRGGIEAWKAAGLPVQPAGGQGQSQGTQQR